MSLQRDTKYPGRYAAPTAGQPQGGFKNRTTPSSFDGSYLEKDWLDDWSGFFSRLLKKMGVTINGLVDTADDSQYFDAAEAAFGTARKNGFTNGDFLANQRGIAFTPSGTLSYTSDQLNYAVDLDGGVLSNNTLDVTAFAIGQADVEGNPRNFVNFDGTVTGGSGSELIAVQNFIENVSKYSGEQVVVSFNIKGSGIGTAKFYGQQFFGTGGSPDASINAFSMQDIAVTTSWQKIQFAFTMPSTLSKTLGSNGDDFFNFSIIKQIGATLAATRGGTAGNFVGTLDTSDWQIERGIIASSFDRVDESIALLRAQRYFQALSIGGNSPMLSRATSGTVVVSSHLVHINPMRSSPSATTRIGTTVSLVALNGGANVGSGVPIVASNGRTFSLSLTVTTVTSTAIYAMSWVGVNETLDFSSEL